MKQPIRSGSKRNELNQFSTWCKTEDGTEAPKQTGWRTPKKNDDDVWRKLGYFQSHVMIGPTCVFHHIYIHITVLITIISYRAYEQRTN